MTAIARQRGGRRALELAVLIFAGEAIFGLPFHVARFFRPTLLAGLGLGSITSAAMPYPVVKPGDSPFQAPQSTGALTALVQSFTMFGSLLVAAPAIAFAGLSQKGAETAANRAAARSGDGAGHGSSGGRGSGRAGAGAA